MPLALQKEPFQRPRTASRLRVGLLLGTALVPLGVGFAVANPLDPTIVAGTATVSGEGTAALRVDQTSDLAIIDWRSFNIDPSETTRFVQPSADSVVLNRVTGGEGASEILGTLKANGQVFLVNPDGILFGKDAVVDVGALVASTHDLLNADFMRGTYRFDQPGNPNASIVNLGVITVEDSGFAALVAPGVRNAGTIRARLGSVNLASANAFTLDFYGDGLIQLAVDDATAGTVIDVATGETLRDLVSNSGLISADGGTVALTAAAARTVINSVINNTGVIEADTIGTRNGKIVLSAATAGKTPAAAPAQEVKVSGTLSAVGAEEGERGGHITLTGEQIELALATIVAFGWNGGGTVLVGGDVGGGDPDHFAVVDGSVEQNDTAVATASSVSMDASSTIDASAQGDGDGGKVILWGDDDTAFDGRISATGGLLEGDGGFVETSGHDRLSYSGLVDISAPHGSDGTLLLDPLDVTIASVGTWVVTPVALQAALATGNIIITTGAGVGNGDITVAEAVSWSSANTLRLSAFRDVNVNALLTSTGGADVELRADSTGTGVGTVTFNGTGGISTAGEVEVFFNPSVNPAGSGVNLLSYTNPIEDYSGFVSGGGTLTPFMLVNSIHDLQNVQNNRAGTYALGRDIDASETATWNGGTGFVPIGHHTGSEAGTSGLQTGAIFDGLDHRIEGLYVSSTHAFSGLFGANFGTIRNLQLIDLDLTNSHSSIVERVGGVVGVNHGLIEDVLVTGVVRGGTPDILPTNNVFGGIGGVVGSNDDDGTVRQVVSNVVVEGFVAGGVVGENFGMVSDVVAIGEVSGLGRPRLGAAGGIAGRNTTKTGDQGGTIVDSYSRVSIEGGGNWAGGVVGQFSGADSFLDGVYAAGSLTGVRTAGVSPHDEEQVTNAYWDMTVADNAALSSSGVGLSTTELKASLPAGFDSTVWGIDPTFNDGYPYLLWQRAVAPTFVALVPSSMTVTPPPSTPPHYMSDPYGGGQTASLGTATSLGAGTIQSETMPHYPLVATAVAGESPKVALTAQATTYAYDESSSVSLLEAKTTGRKKQTLEVGTGASTSMAELEVAFRTTQADGKVAVGIGNSSAGVSAFYSDDKNGETVGVGADFSYSVAKVEGQVSLASPSEAESVSLSVKATAIEIEGGGEARVRVDATGVSARGSLSVGLNVASVEASVSATKEIDLPFTDKKLKISPTVEATASVGASAELSAGLEVQAGKLTLSNTAALVVGIGSKISTGVTLAIE